MTNDQVWHQSTAIERCEILKSRLDQIERPDQRSKNHLDRCNESASLMISAGELARLRRIEEAATRLLSEAWTDGGGLSKVDGRFVDILRGAIWREARSDD